jgi:hypothetical protein
MKFVTYQASTPEHNTKHIESKILDHSVGESLVNDKRDFAYSFEIPQTVSSFVNPSSRVIQISYVLSIKAKVLIRLTDLCYVDLIYSFKIVLRIYFKSCDLYSNRHWEFCH